VVAAEVWEWVCRIVKSDVLLADTGHTRDYYPSKDRILLL